MKCPKCQGDMQPGTVGMKMRFLSLPGLPSKDLYFNPADGSKRLLLPFTGKTDAYRCSSCGTLLVVAGKS